MHKCEHERRWIWADVTTAAIFVGVVGLWRARPDLNLWLLLIVAAACSALLNFIILHRPTAYHTQPQSMRKGLRHSLFHLAGVQPFTSEVSPKIRQSSRRQP